MQYPLGEHEREQIASKTGKKLDEITLDAVMRNQIAPDDIKISKEMLHAQGQVAKENGNDQMEKNFEQAEGCSGKMVVSDVFRPVIAVGTFSTSNDPAFQSIHNFLITVDVTVDN